MSLRKAITMPVALLGACLASVVLADEAPRSPEAPKTAKKAMRMDEPMSTKMMKPGMKVGDVKKDADKRAREMKPMLEQEEKSMERTGPE